jgi:23S rRNA pseudouridine1911/1915/1917 synthase
MIATREVHREYLALSQRPWRGELLREVEFAIGRDPRQRLRMAVVDLEKQSGKTAHTSLQCLDSNDQGCLVHCTLHTGRTHQIRVHMAAIGLPLLADGLYVGSSSPWISRQSLHAFRLGFKHPFSARDLQFESPLPADIQAAVLGMGLTNPLG